MPTLITAPTERPVDPLEVLAHLRLAPDSDLVQVAGLLDAAIEDLQERTGWQFCAATYEETFDQFGPRLVLPRPPLASVTSITYVDTGGETQTVDSSLYAVKTGRTPGEIELAYGATWPAVRSQSDAVTVRYMCGYASAALVPAGVKAAIKLWVEAHYDQVGQMFGTSQISDKILETALRLIPRVRRLR